jgi:hypothetical protein
VVPPPTSIFLLVTYEKDGTPLVREYWWPTSPPEANPSPPPGTLVLFAVTPSRHRTFPPSGPPPPNPHSLSHPSPFSLTPLTMLELLSPCLWPDFPVDPLLSLHLADGFPPRSSSPRLSGMSAPPALVPSRSTPFPGHPASSTAGRPAVTSTPSPSFFRGHATSPHSSSPSRCRPRSPCRPLLYVILPSRMPVSWSSSPAHVCGRQIPALPQRDSASTDRTTTIAVSFIFDWMAVAHPGHPTEAEVQGCSA